MVSHDIHIHTRLSTCSGDLNSTVPAFIDLLKDTSVHTIGIADHMWDSDVPGAWDWYKPQNFDHIRQVVHQIPENFDNHGIRILLGCETEFDQYGTLAISREHAQMLDFVLAPHSHTHMLDQVMPAECKGNWPKHAQFLVDSFLRLVNHRDIDCITSIAHPFAPLAEEPRTNEILRLIPDRVFEDCFSSAHDAGVFLELNGDCFNNLFHSEADIAASEYNRMYHIAKECGCKFTYGSDSHSPSVYHLFDWMDAAVRIFGLSDDDFAAF